MKSIQILLFSIFLLLAINFIETSSNVHGGDRDLENPLLSDGRYNQLSTTGNDESSDSEDEADTSASAWKVPRAQFEVGVPIYGTIFGFMTAWGQDDPISLFIRAIYIMSFLVCAQVYFGFYLGCQRRPDACCSYLPRIVYTKLDFPAGPLDVSFGRWISGPFSWITAAISFLPEDAYVYLEKNAFFPNRPIIHLIFMVQLLYYFGMYDCYRGNIMTSTTTSAST